MVPDIVARDNHGDAGPNRALAWDERTMPLVERRMSYTNARNIGDRIELAWGKSADRDAEFAECLTMFRCRLGLNIGEEE